MSLHLTSTVQHSGQRSRSQFRPAFPKARTCCRHRYAPDSFWVSAHFRCFPAKPTRSSPIGPT